MTIAVRKTDYFTEEQYLQLEEKSDSKNEYWFGEILAMSGARVAHNIITSSLLQILGAKLKSAEKNCNVFTSDMKLRAENGSVYFYPDLMVRCSQKNPLNMNAAYIEDPDLGIEVFSPSTRDYDRTAKLLTYQKIPNVNEILLIEPSFIKVEYFYRSSDNRFIRSEFHAIEDELSLKHLGIRISLEEIYHGISFNE